MAQTNGSPWGVRTQPSEAKRRFGEVAQAANPQQSDPAQNQNRGGFPQPRKSGGRRFSGRRYGPTGVVPNQAQAATPMALESLQSAPGEAGGGGAPADPIGKQPPEATPDGVPERSQEIFNQQVAGGQYGDGGYTPIDPDAQWGGRGYSGGDPREAALPEAEAPAPAPAPPQGGKSGGTGQVGQGLETGNPALDQAAAGAQAGKGGGGAGGATQAQPQPGPGAQDPAAPAPDPNVPPPSGDVPGSGGVDDTGATDFNFDDTGQKAAQPPAAGANPDDPGFWKLPTEDLKGAEKRYFDQYIAAGGKPEDFYIRGRIPDDVDLSSFGAPQSPAWKAERDRIREKFYADQIGRIQK